MTFDNSKPGWRAVRRWAMALASATLLVGLSQAACKRKPQYPTFATPDDAVGKLADTVKTGTLDELVGLFGPEGRELVASSDPATGRRNREVFLVAFAEGWRLQDLSADRKELIVGNEDWPFPIPLVKEHDGWRWDAAAGREEVLARRIGRNELAVLKVCETYVLAQRAYASRGRDDKPAGLYARRFASEPGKQNGLHWPTKRGDRHSPLGSLVAEAAGEGYRLKPAGEGPTPFHGYYFRILEGQGEAAPGGAFSYVVDGEMSRGFALIAWPAHYDETGIMTFIVNHDGVVYEKDLGTGTPRAAGAMTRFDPDQTWRKAAADAIAAP